jgi:hypothetical protein
MNDKSILTTIKKLLGLTEEYTAFDTDIIVHINTVLTNLIQMGVGPVNGFMIEDSTKKWSDFVPSDKLLFVQQLISYVYIKVRLLFDPPANTNLIDSLKANALELEFRLYSEHLKEVIASETVVEPIEE